MVSSPTRSPRLPTSPPTGIPFPMQQGDHVAVVGDTGTGKSTLMARLLLARQFSIAVKTKRDPIKFPGKRVTKLNRGRLQRSGLDLRDPRVDRWYLDLSTGRDIRSFRREQQEEINLLFDRVWDAGGWAVLLDETFYVNTVLKLKEPLEAMLTQGRSMGITMMMGIQRPVDVTRFVMSSASHVIAYRQDGRDVETLTKATTTALKEPVTSLGRFEFVWFNRITREIWRGRLDLDGNALVGEMVA